MSQDAGIEGGLGGSTPPDGGAGGQGINPAWEPILNHIPEDKRGEVMPHFQKWDQGYNSLQENYKPWQRFSQAGIGPDDLEQAYGVYQALNNNPMEFKALLESWMEESGVTPPQQQQAGNGQVTDEGDETAPWESKFQELQQQNELMAQVLLQNHQASIQEQEDAELDQVFSDLTEKYKQTFGSDPDPEVFEPFILAMLSNDMDPEEAFNRFTGYSEQMMAQSRRPLAPRLMGSGGSLPSSRPDYAKMSNDQVKQHIVDRLMAAKRD
jgi:hypothetical protein